MDSVIKDLGPQMLVGKFLEMNFVQNNTVALWRSFMPLKNSIANQKTEELFSVEIYPVNFSFTEFNPTINFIKWAAVEVNNFEDIPDGMSKLLIPGGLYAEFVYKGPANQAGDFYRKIFMDWLPSSIYVIDSRPHFAVMGSKYKHNDPDSEENIYIPLRLR